MIDWNEIEAKWQKVWAEQKQFETNPSELPKKFITVAYPYPNSPQHIGHGRTYTITDVHARFYRMCGYNVLFPMAFHYTGTPILAMSKKIQEGDQEIIRNLKDLYMVPEDIISEFIEPIKIADYFHEEIKAGMIEMGYSIDWRREFTTIDPGYSKFVEWQVNKQRQKNLIIQGSHPVGWCPKDQNPVSQHDTLGDLEPEFTEYTLIKFKMGEYTIPTATLRPETIFGVVNLWVNPDVTYVKITIDGDKWITSKECAAKLEFLDHNITINDTISGSELIGCSVTTPNKIDVPILAASFVDQDTGTGIVMSVPAHAPFDLQALYDIQRSADSKLAEIATRVTPVSIITTEGYGANPAHDMLVEMKITDQNDPKINDITKEIYAKEFYSGHLNENTGIYAGMTVADAKDAVKTQMIQDNTAEILLELSSPIKCRCGTRCVVKILNDQWFLNYGDPSWKELATKCFANMSILPSEIRGEFEYVIGWLRERACARQQGMGTKLPWDKNWIVESLADSVIYMAYYTISRHIADIADRLDDSFFDYVFGGRGDPTSIADMIGITRSRLEDIRSEFRYFYPVDSRHSGRDLVPNHLTFFVMNHTVLFEEEYWPKEIVVNGSVLMNGSKMSKSMGNIIPIRNAIREYGADPIRLAMIISSELLQDADFNIESISNIQDKLSHMYDQCSTIHPEDGTVTTFEDRWILSKMIIMNIHATASIEKMRLREALHHVLFSFGTDINWYLKRAKVKGRTDLNYILYTIHVVLVKMLSPFAPHISEEMWSVLKQPGLASTCTWPKFTKSQIEPSILQAEEMLKSIINDITKILKVTKITPKRIIIYTASETKSKIYRAVLQQMISGKNDMRDIMKSLLSDADTIKAKEMPSFIQMSIKDILAESSEIREMRYAAPEFNETEFLVKELTSIATTEFAAEIQIYNETDSTIYDPKNKAKNARPFKPAILVEN